MIDRRWIILCVLFLSRTAMGFQFQSVASVGPELSKSLLLDYAQIGTLIGLYFLPGALISIPGGFIMQRLGDKTICAAGLGLMTVGGAVLGFSGDFALAFLGRLVSGTGSILFNQVVTKMTTDWFAGREIVFAMAVVLASWPFGVAAGLLIQPPLAAGLGWPSVMLLAAALCGVVLVLVALTYRAPSAVAAAPAPAVPSVRVASAPPDSLMPLIIAGSVWAFANLGLVLFFSFTPELLREFGFSAGASASVPSSALWIIMLSLPLGGFLTEKLGRPDGVIMLCSCATGLLLLAEAADIAPPLVSMVFGLIMGVPAGAMLALPARILAPQQRAAGLGIFFTCYYSLMTLGPPMAGWLHDDFGTARGAVLLASALFLAIAPLHLLFLRQTAAHR